MRIEQLQQVATAANTIARWCGVRDVTSLTRGALCEKAGLPDGTADLFVLFGGGVSGLVDTLAEAMRAGVARRYAIVGGRGHATYWLDEAVERMLEGWDERICPRPTPYERSEAEMLAALLAYQQGLQVDLLETHSTNCGNNITYLMDLLEQQGQVPASVILCQDAVMQRRMGVTWQRQVQDRPTFASTRVLNWAAYDAALTVADGTLAWAYAPQGIWPIDTYLDLLAGEVARLTDDAHGYGPCGRDFVVHVDVPEDVRAAAQVLGDTLGADGRPPDERYA